VVQYPPSLRESEEFVRNCLVKASLSLSLSHSCTHTHTHTHTLMHAHTEHLNKVGGKRRVISRLAGKSVSLCFLPRTGQPASVCVYVCVCKRERETAFCGEIGSLQVCVCVCVCVCVGETAFCRELGSLHKCVCMRVCVCVRERDFFFTAHFNNTLVPEF